MIKRILILIFMLTVVSYLLLAVTVLNTPNAELICTDIELSIKNLEHGDFITKNEIHSILRNKKIYPVDKKIDEISTNDIENELQKHPLIDEVECYKTPSGKIGIEIHQRIPVLRVFSTKGDFFVDNKREIMPAKTKCNAYIAVATGNITKEFASGPLYEFVMYLSNNEFWNNQIEQIHIVKENEVELIPRVGDHIIVIGTLTDYSDKLARLKLFYEKVLNQVGWNKYRKINIEFSNQIICTKANLK